MGETFTVLLRFSGIGWIADKQFDDEFEAYEYGSNTVKQSLADYSKCLDAGIFVDYVDDYKVMKRAT
jgi:hypothetical protein